MKRSAMLAVLVVLLIPGLLLADGAGPATERLPLSIVGRARINGGKLPDSTPLLTIGEIAPAAQLGLPELYPKTPTSWVPVPQRGDADTIITALVAGEKHIYQSDSQQETVIYLVCPESSFESYSPMALSRKGNEITLEMVTGTADIPLDAVPAPTRAAYLISLGKLEPGDYQLNVRVTNMAADEKTYPLYARKTIDSASAKFNVRDGMQLLLANQMPVNKPAVMVNVTDLKSDSDAKAGLLCQLPMSLPIEGKLNAGEAYSVIVGAFDGNAWIQAAHVAGAEPQILPPKARQPLWALVRGPDLDTGEWMSLREVRWAGNKPTIIVELWRDQSPRRQNLRFSPLLLVPVQTNTTGAVPDLKVTVEFHGLTALEAGKPYVDDAEQDNKTAETATAN